MSNHPALRSRLLLVEDDLDTRELLGSFLRDEGYEVALAASPKEALLFLEQQPFHLVLTDLFTGEAREPLRSVESLQKAAGPAPVGVMTGWKVKAEEARRQGLAFLVPKPFDLDELLTTIAGSLNLPFGPEQQRQAEVAKRFLAILESKKLEALEEVCTQDVRYYPPVSSSYAAVPRISGLAAYRPYIEGAYRYFQDFRFEDVLVYARPKGVAVRYFANWVGPDGQAKRVLAFVVFHFRGALISQIGVRVNYKRLTKPPAQGKK